MFVEGYRLGVYFFFFQAEDGIRYADVTGVQTCALPIFNDTSRHPQLPPRERRADERADQRPGRATDEQAFEERSGSAAAPVPWLVAPSLRVGEPLGKNAQPDA